MIADHPVVGLSPDGGSPPAPARAVRALAAALVLAVAAALAGGAAAGRWPSSGRVVRALDGDTIVVAGVGPVRYLGVDTPELHHPSKPVQRFARRAARPMRGWCWAAPCGSCPTASGATATAGSWPTSTWGRRWSTPSWCARGLARAYPFAPNTRHAAQFARLERVARARGRGLWGPAEGGLPWGRP